MESHLKLLIASVLWNEIFTNGRVVYLEVRIVMGANHFRVVSRWRLRVSRNMVHVRFQYFNDLTYSKERCLRSMETLHIFNLKNEDIRSFQEFSDLKFWHMWFACRRNIVARCRQIDLSFIRDKVAVEVNSCYKCSFHRKYNMFNTKCICQIRSTYFEWSFQTIEWFHHPVVGSHL